MLRAIGSAMVSLSKICASIAAFWAVLFFGFSALAQQTPGSATDAGQIEKRIQQQRQKPVIEDRTEPSVSRPARPAEILPAPDLPERRFILSAVNIGGASVYTVADFSTLYEDFIGQEIGPAEIETIIERISAKYAEDGYFLSSATAPPQDLEFGIVNIAVTEGYIERVVYSGARPGRQSMFDAWAAKITASVPARLTTVERYLLLMSELPGITATPSLDEIEGGNGAYEMKIAIRHDRIDGYSSLDNRGTDPVGPQQGSISGGLNSRLGALERIRVSAFTIPREERELLYGEIYAQLPVGTEGTQAFVSASRSLVDIYSESRASQLQSAGTKYSIGAWHPLVRQQEFALYLNTSFDYHDSRQSAASDNHLDRLRVGRVGGRIWFKDDIGGSTTTSLTYSRGFDILAASPYGYNVSRTDGESRFSKVTVDINRIQKFTEDLWGELNVSGQHSKHVLLSAEEFSLGGASYGRAYDPSEVSDSRGIAGSFELRHRVPVDEGLLSKLWVYGFFDGGTVWQTGNTKESLTSGGVGLRFFPYEGVRASLELAKPLTRPVSEKGDNDARVFFSLAIEF